MKRLASQCGAALALATALLASGVAQATPVLHEWVPPPGDPKQQWAREGRLPDNIRLGDRFLPRPEDRSRRGSEPVHGRGQMDRQTSMAADRTTTHDGRLRYAAEFNPSVVPFKRQGALDAVGEDFTLRLANAKLLPLTLSRRPTPPDRDPFWGSMMLQVTEGEQSPFPRWRPARRSSAIEPRRLRGSSSCATRPTISGFAPIDRDPCGWCFLPTRRAATSLPRSPRWSRPGWYRLDLRPRVPDSVLRTAEKVHRHIGVRRSQSVYRQLERLVAYFRNFEAKALDRSSGNTYLDIALSQRGVCRHRSYAFVITAQALGIPARYVYNEAHAFTEVFVPRLGWIRVDLGGASSELQIRNAQKKAIHDAGPDPFPRPGRFTANYSQLGQRVTGLRPNQRARRAATNLRRFRRSERGAGGRTSAGGTGSTGTGTAGAARTETAGEVATAEGADGQAGTEASATQIPTTVTIDASDQTVERGQQIRLWGRVRSNGRGVANLRVELYVSQNGDAAEAMLGATVTDSTGAYDVRLAVPLAVPVGDYRVFAATPGDDRHAPGLSR